MLRYLHYANYAEELKTIADCENDAGARSTLIAAAQSYDKLAASLLSILKTRAQLAA